MRTPQTMFGTLLLCVAAGAQGGGAASAPDLHTSRYQVAGGSVRPDGERSVSGRYSFSAGVTGRAPQAPLAAKNGVRFAAKSTVTADCSDVLLADSFE